jgi:BlaI family transcriptional regulator, penicillinase repressor
VNKPPRISKTEWDVMKVVWAEEPCTASRVIEVLTFADPTWHPKTVKAFLNRLMKKKALGFNMQGRAYLYRTLVRKEQCVDVAINEFLGRVFESSVKGMLVYFLARSKLSAQDIWELSRLLEMKNKGNCREDKLSRR